MPDVPRMPNVSQDRPMPPVPPRALSADQSVAKVHHDRARRHARVAAISAKCAASDCPKCEGTGNRPEYAHIDAGLCWDCNGTGRRFQPDP
jgi:hypothetical protein